MPNAHPSKPRRAIHSRGDALKLAALALPVALSGCAMSLRDTAVVAANTIHDVAETENRIILDYCVPRYRAAATMEALAKVDAICLPAQKAYLSTKVLWQSFVATVQLAKLGKATDAEVMEAVGLLSQAYANLERLVKGLR
ncbi:hypothetical protein A7982_13111 [Minicystis rosea]|nr:hypothetical protein A7982_13111 [Minicystis rosea]